MEAASVHQIPDRRRMRTVTSNGELRGWMPQTLEEAWQMIEGLLGEVAQASAAHTRLLNEMEAKRVADIESSRIMEVLAYWRSKCAKRPELTKLVATSPRWKKVKERLEEGWTVEDLQHVVDYCVTDPFLNGSHPKTEGKAYLGAETLFRDSDQVEKRLGQWQDAQDQDFDGRLDAWMERHAPEMARALEVERQLGVLVGLEPTAFEPTPSEMGGAA